MILLVKKAISGDTDAFIKLMFLQNQKMYKIAKIYLHNDQDIADVIQSTILFCFENISVLQKPKHFKTWFIRILINECKDFLHKNKNYCLPDETSESSVFDITQSHLEFEELLLSVDKKYRIILILYYMEGFKIREIAQILDMNENTVKTRLSKGKELCLKQRQFSPCLKGECL